MDALGASFPSLCSLLSQGQARGGHGGPVPVQRAEEGLGPHPRILPRSKPRGACGRGRLWPDPRAA